MAPQPMQAQTGRAAAADWWLAAWLYAVTGLVLVMVVVGGATRLTGSGLSITEWQPIVGALPPLTDAAWQAAFAKYREIPQYHMLNKGMSLEAFKGIFWWEWGHRFLGRFIGFAFALPLAFFAIRRQINGALALRLVGLLVLGGLQGALGWYMVTSGLSVRTDVSQYRLAAHLLLASVLMAALLWTALDVANRSHNRIRLRTLAAGSRALAALICGLVLVQVGAGALVAGLKAGLAYNTWPLMDGYVVPPGLAAMTPLHLNVFENAATVQFDHRALAYLIAGLVGWQAVRVGRSADDERMRQSAIALAAAVAAQIGLGVWTLLAHVPLSLALMHQATAMLVLAAAVWHLHAVTRE
jgi:heme a synthase